MSDCCAANLTKPGTHLHGCRHRTVRRSRLGSWLREARAWWRQRAAHDDRDPCCVYSWDREWGGDCRVCREDGDDR